MPGSEEVRRKSQDLDIIFCFVRGLLDIMITQHIVLSQIIAMRTLKQCKQQIWSEHLEKYKTQNFMKCDAESLLVESCFVA